ncbi:hypothetical protein Tco_0281631 [Tanacetum coccineum]
MVVVWICQMDQAIERKKIVKFKKYFSDIRKEEGFEDDRKYDCADWKFIQRGVNDYSICSSKYKVQHGNGGKSVSIDSSFEVAVKSYVLVATSSGTDLRVFEKLLGSENIVELILIRNMCDELFERLRRSSECCYSQWSYIGVSQFNHLDLSLSMVEEEGPEADTKRVHKLLHTKDRLPLSFVSCYNDGLLAENLQSILGLKDAENERRVSEKRASEFVSLVGSTNEWVCRRLNVGWVEDIKEGFQLVHLRCY